MTAKPTTATPSADAPVSSASGQAGGRLLWCDVAKGFAMIVVVYFHATYGVITDIPVSKWWEHMLTGPSWYFSMPLFFIAAGVFAGSTIWRDRRVFIDRTVLHLVYLFVIWNVIQFAVRILFANVVNHPLDDPVRTVLMIPIDPLDVTWFLEALIAYYVVMRLLRNVPPVYLFIGGAILAMLPEAPGYAIGRSQSYFVYFVAGYAASAMLRNYDRRPNGWVVAALNAVFAVIAYHAIHGGWLDSRVLTFLMSCLGGVATVSATMWVAHLRHIGWLLYIGRNSLPIFLLHTMFTVATREVLLRVGVTDNVALLIVAATTAGVVIPLIIHALSYRLRMPWLFERPGWLHLPPAAPAPQESLKQT